MTQGILIPSIKDVASVDVAGLTWILVIEKEATFRSLATASFWKTGGIGEGLLITAKGYPDIATRAFLRYLATSPLQSGCQRPAIYGLMDFDPDGLGILSTYKHGSVALAHENAQLVVPSISWLGLQSRDLQLLDSTVEGLELIRLTVRDRRKAISMLKKGLFAEGGGEPRWRRELQVMLILNVKAEIQIMSNVDGGLQRWLDRRIMEEFLAGR
ncbi:MAG: hypothetical protein M1817_000502 [Caeruleum heppii]|nr:MAG: hypothetical protein M1817_000502 [Caeruleum heppii]